MVSLRTFFGDDVGVLRDRNLQLLLLANLNAYLGIALVSPLLSTLTGPFAVSETRIGLMVSVFTGPAIVAIPLAGVLADRYGRKPMLVAGLLLFGVGGVGISFTADFRAVLGLRMLQGVGFAALTPTIITSIGDLYAETEEATAQGLRVMSSGVSQIIFPFVAGVVVVVNWRYPFLLYGLAFPAAVAVFGWFDDPMAASRRDPSGEPSPPHGLRSLLTLALEPRVAAVIVARAFPPFALVGFFTYNSIVVVRILDGTPGQAGVLVAVVSLSYATAATQAGRLTGVFETRIRPLIGAHGLLASGLAVIAVAWHVAIVGVGGVLLGVGFGISMPLYRSMITSMAPDTLRGGLVSVSESGGRIGTTIAPIVMGAGIASAAPRIGFDPAVRWAVLGVGLASGATGIACLIVVDRSPPIAHVDPAS